MGMAIANRMSVDAFLALPEQRLVHELVAGELVVSPSPSHRHEAAYAWLFGWLHGLIATRGDLALRGSRADLRFGPQTVLSPDLFVYAWSPTRPHPDWIEVPVPLLVIEILSRSTAARDRGIKRQLYQTAGVEEYWIVDLDRHRIERWRPEDTAPDLVHDVLAFRLSGGLEGTLDLRALFAEVDR